MYTIEWGGFTRVGGKKENDKNSAEVPIFKVIWGSEQPTTVGCFVIHTLKPMAVIHHIDKECISYTVDKDKAC